MKSPILGLVLCLFTLSSFSQNNHSPSSADKSEWTTRKTKKWFKKKTWLMNAPQKPHATIDQAEFAKAYNAHPERWQKAFAFMRDSNLAALKPGRYNIDGNDVYATVTEGPLKTMENSSYEAHKQYADIQMALTNQEQIGVAPYSTVKAKTPFNDAQDIGYFDAEGQFYEAVPGTFFIFFPEKDAHRPGVKTTTSDRDKKLVIKVKTK